MDIAFENLKRLPFATVMAARNYGMDNISVPETAKLGSKLCMAILRGDYREVISLLDAGAPLDHREDPDGWTPLIYSIYYDNRRARNELLDRGASPYQGDYARRTPIMFAAIRGDIELIRELISRGADPEQNDAVGKNARDFAMEYRQYECIRFLKKADNSCEVKNGRWQ